MPQFHGKSEKSSSAHCVRNCSPFAPNCAKLHSLILFMQTFFVLNCALNYLRHALLYRSTNRNNLFASSLTTKSLSQLSRVTHGKAFFFTWNVMGNIIWATNLSQSVGGICNAKTRFEFQGRTLHAMEILGIQVFAVKAFLFTRK